jgi:hypothetical protein
MSVPMTNELTKALSDAFLKHAAHAASQYDSLCRNMAAEILCLRHALNRCAIHQDLQILHEQTRCPVCLTNELRATLERAAITEENYLREVQRAAGWERECADGDQIMAILGIVDETRTEGGWLRVDKVKARVEATVERLNMIEGDYQRVCSDVKRLQDAIRAHRDARGDDRCWMDDEELYKVLPEGYTPPVRDSAVELERCQQFIASRQHPATVYVSPEREIEELRKQVEALTDKAIRFDLDQVGIESREKDAVELVEARAIIEEFTTKLDQHSAQIQLVNERLGRVIQDIKQSLSKE